MPDVDSTTYTTFAPLQTDVAYQGGPVLYLVWGPFLEKSAFLQKQATMAKGCCESLQSWLCLHGYSDLHLI